MTLEDLEHIFRFQTTESEEFKPTGRLEYLLYEGRDRVAGSIETAKIADLVPLLDNFIFEGYKDRTPYFVKPEVIIPL